MSTVLVVDDEKSVRTLLRDVLELEGHQVIDAADGPEGLYRLHRGGVDLIVLDVMMPNTSGIEVLTDIRNDQEFCRMPVLMLTAATDDTTTWAGLTAGADVYLEKPFDHLGLLTWIDRLLALGEGGQTAPAGSARSLGRQPGNSTMRDIGVVADSGLLYGIV